MIICREREKKNAKLHSLVHLNLHIRRRPREEAFSQIFRPVRYDQVVDCNYLLGPCQTRHFRTQYCDKKALQ
jgi:hypothetical protein